jgi:hypothetical protein
MAQTPTPNQTPKWPQNNLKQPKNGPIMIQNGLKKPQTTLKLPKTAPKQLRLKLAPKMFKTVLKAAS